MSPSQNSPQLSPDWFHIGSNWLLTVDHSTLSLSEFHALYVALNIIVPVKHSQTCSHISSDLEHLVPIATSIQMVIYQLKGRSVKTNRQANNKKAKTKNPTLHRLVGLRRFWRTWLIHCLSKSSCDSVLLGVDIFKPTLLYNEMGSLWSSDCPLHSGSLNDLNIKLTVAIWF